MRTQSFGTGGFIIGAKADLEISTGQWPPGGVAQAASTRADYDDAVARCESGATALPTRGPPTPVQRFRRRRPASSRSFDDRQGSRRPWAHRFVLRSMGHRQFRPAPGWRRRGARVGFCRSFAQGRLGRSNFKEKDLGWSPERQPRSKSTPMADNSRPRRASAGHRQRVLGDRPRVTNELGQGDAARVRSYLTGSVAADDCRPFGLRHGRPRLRQISHGERGARMVTRSWRAGDRHHRRHDGGAAAGARHDHRQCRLAAHMQASLSATRTRSLGPTSTSSLPPSHCLLPAGLPTDLGRKRCSPSVIGFTVASVLCAGATSRDRMVVFPALQGVSGAFLVRSPKQPCSTSTRAKNGQASCSAGGS